MLGLGAGVTATLARAGDTLHYYEINPLVVEIANRDFGFLRGCPAAKQVLLGDGRLVLEPCRMKRWMCWRWTLSPATRSRCIC